MNSNSLLSSPGRSRVILLVIDMYPSIPFQLLIKSIKRRWNKIEKDTKLPMEEFIKGIDVIMNSLYFKFGENHYQQVNGLPIGLSVLSTLANIVIQDIEEEIMKKHKKEITFYGRFVDDSYIIIKKDKIETIVKKIDSFDERIKLTYELNNSINFLDLKIIKNKDKTISIDMFKKPTFSGRYINYLSDHSMSTKIGIAKNLADKIIKISDKIFHKKNLKIAKRELLLNSYPREFIEKQFKSQIEKLKESKNFIQNNNSENINSENKIQEFSKKLKYIHYSKNTKYFWKIKINIRKEI